MMYSGKASEKESQRHKFQLPFGLSNALTGNKAYKRCLICLAGEDKRIILLLSMS